MQLLAARKRKVEISGELLLHLVEDGVLGGGKGATRQVLTSGGVEGVGDGMMRVEANPERRHQLLYKVGHLLYDKR